MSQHDHAHDHEGLWTAEFWDDRYRSSPGLWSGHANAVLVAEAAGLAPGRALDVGCGEGGDAFWLAARGWQVDGIDVSQVALDRAAAQAREAGPEIESRVTWTQRDLLSWTPPEATYDLVSVSFVHMDGGDRGSVYAGLAGAVVPGGTFLVGAHSPLDIGVVPRPPDPDLYFTAEDVAAALGEAWEVVTSEARPRPGKHPDGWDVTLHDTVLRAVRRE